MDRYAVGLAPVTRVYYNENDPQCAAWLRQLIADGELPAGDVDDRSIEDVRPSDLWAYDQCHFFAGIGGWPLALRLAGWPDDRPVYTGSCPCQPFSVAGKRAGNNDARHLWPAFRWLIAQQRPAELFGEQVASKAGREWLVGVRADLEALGYAVGGADLCAASTGAPNIRQRLWWVGESQQPGLEGHPGHGVDRRESGRQSAHQGRPVAPAGSNSGMGDTKAQRRSKAEHGQPGDLAEPSQDSKSPWSDAIWIPCADGKARRIKPGIEPLVDGLPRGMVPCGDINVAASAEARVIRLKGYGNAIVPQLAAEFITAYMETMT